MTPELIIIFVLWGIVNLQFGRRIELQAIQKHNIEMAKAISRAEKKEDKEHE